jgi:hypothetical protein
MQVQAWSLNWSIFQLHAGKINEGVRNIWTPSSFGEVIVILYLGNNWTSS